MDLLRINAGKLAIRIEPSLQFVTFKEFLSNALEDGPASLMSLFQRIQELIRNNPSSSKSLLIFDDLSAFSSLGYSSAQTLRCLQKLRKMLPCESLVVFASHNDDFARFTNTFDFCIEISLIGTGLGKGVTGKLEIAQRKLPFESLPLKTVYHYLLGERSVNMFLMGSAQAAFI
uniref:Elongator complex protein 6 n=1 Tax=Acrobeloides nanus TaxID=290746 RepID=A0A914E1I4_9BILA